MIFKFIYIKSMKILTDLLFWISPILEIWRFLPTCDRQFRLFQKLEAWRKLTEALRLLKGDNFSYFLSCLGKIIFVGFLSEIVQTYSRHIKAYQNLKQF